jgi:DNA-damage-inducible protein J
MAQVSMTVRIDSQKKARFDELCAEFGMSSNTALNVFVNAVIQQNCIPFLIKAGEYGDMNLFRKLRQRADNGETPDLSMEEIDEEITLARAARHNRL